MSYKYYNCKSLESIVVDAGNPCYDSRGGCNAIIETKSNTMVAGCKNTVIPSSVTNLGDYCFYGCSSLVSIDIPSSVTSLGWGCFWDCSSLKIVICRMKKVVKGKELFSDTLITDATLYVPDHLLGTYKSTKPWSGFGTILPLQSLSVSAESLTLSATEWNGHIGNSFTLTTTVLPENTTDKTVTWTSSNEKIATVDANGKVTAIAIGEATITATCGSVSASCTVKVVATPAESITLSQSTAELKVGETVSLSATVLPESTTDKTVTWSSSAENIATVDAEGKVTAVAIGEATITATCGSVSASCTVKVVATPAESITLSQSTAQLKVGESVALTATVLPESTTDKTVTWSSSDKTVATVDANGKVTAIAIGEATITATCGSASASCKVTVLPILAESLTVTPESWTGEEGESFTLVATVLPENATDKSVSWSSSDPEIATVDAGGNVSVLKGGYCVITVSTQDGSNLSAKCTITGVSGIDDIFTDADARFDVYSLQGILIKKDCSRDDLRQLSPGAYILWLGNVSKKIIIR